MEWISYTSTVLIHWGRVMHICVSKLTIIGSDNGLPLGWCQAIIWTNAGILLIRPLRTNFREILIKIYTFSFRIMHLKMYSAKWRPFCLRLNVLIPEKPQDFTTSHQPFLINVTWSRTVLFEIIGSQSNYTENRCSQHCSCWWSSAVRHWAISRHSDDQVCVEQDRQYTQLFVFKFRTLRVEFLELLLIQH